VTAAFVKYSRSGSSTGTAEVQFAKRTDASAAVRDYNGVAFSMIGA